MRQCCMDAVLIIHLFLQVSNDECVYACMNECMYARLHPSGNLLPRQSLSVSVSVCLPVCIHSKLAKKETEAMKKTHEMCEDQLQQTFMAMYQKDSAKFQSLMVNGQKG
eukprot:GHVU01178524.1.p4 GENE.GHVU01178524.1~~GHVU01178524.1.p4  ORF type:complete len:109 (-),score=15.05 GHVU01178524.1:1702-2028(-)